MHENAWKLCATNIKPSKVTDKTDKQIKTLANTTRTKMYYFTKM